MTRSRTVAPIRWVALMAATILALAVFASAHAQLQVQIASEAFGASSDDASEKVGVSLAVTERGIVITFVPEGTGMLPDAETGLNGTLPEDVHGRVDQRAAFHLSEALLVMPGGIVFRHAEARLADVIAAYRSTLESQGMTLVAERPAGGGRSLVFSGPNGPTRLTFVHDVDAIQAYVGR
jgi:hypothetical protein